VRPATLLQPDLHHAVRLVDGLHHALRRSDGVRDGLLDVSVLSGAQRRLENRLVLVIGSGDQNGVDIFTLQDTPVVLVGVHLPVVGHKGVQPVRGHVAGGHEHLIGVCAESREYLVAAGAGTDDRHLNPVVGAKNRTGSHRRGRRLQESSSVLH
jgi:hypothetical protein